LQISRIYKGEDTDVDDKRFLNASKLRDEGKLREAISEFFGVAGDAEDPVDKAGVLLNIATTFNALGEYDQARQQMLAARRLVSSLEDWSAETPRDGRIVQLKVSLDFEDAEICSFEGQLDMALGKFDQLLKTYGRMLQEPELRESYEMTQTRRAFLLADLGRWKEALPILKEAESFEERKPEIYFYLGHCYLSGGEHRKAAEKLIGALSLGLPASLEFRAHCELGMAYSNLRNYEQAKVEFEKCVASADQKYLDQARLWKRLESVCRALGLTTEADRYAGLAS
jgi:tetratricopeptide (TPR) repeat protein